ncbi:E3 ubiquitin-protein ligase SINA-like 2 [Wolffia australiana]
MVKFSAEEGESTRKRRCIVGDEDGGAGDQIEAARSSAAESTLIQLSDGIGIAISDSGKVLGTAFVDLDAFECPVCFELMDSPIFQCQNGHVTCSSCFTKLSKCHTCSVPPSPTRCLALEKVVDSMKLACPYASLGCGEIISYSKRESHKESCSRVPCHCPILCCRFSGPVSELLLHLGRVHGPLIADFSFTYDQWLAVSFDGSGRHHQFLIADDGTLFIILFNSGSLCLVSIGPNSLKERFSYRMKVKREKRWVEFESVVGVVQRAEDSFPSDFSLLVSPEFLDEQSMLMMEVLVWRNKLL